MAGDVAEIALVTQEFAAAQRVDETERRLVALAVRAREGDRQAFEDLMLQTQRKVVSTAWRMLGNEDDARDAAQDVFLKVYRYLGSFQTDQNFQAWLYRITVNVCLDLGRRRRRRESSHASIDAEPAPEVTFRLVAGGSAESDLARSEQRELVRKALLSLPEKERSALVLRDLEGLSAEEAAEVLGTKAATVRSQASMARAKIKTFCDRWIARRTRETS